MKKVDWSDKILTVRSLEVIEGIESPDMSFIKARATESHVKGGVTDTTISNMVTVYEFSVNGSTNWHSTFTAGDLYMRTSTDNGATWGDAIRIVGETGATGPWINYVFGKSNSSTTYPTWSATGSYPNGTWLDAPPTLSAGEFCWYTKATYSGDTRTSNWSTPVRMTGEKGETGAKGDTGSTGAQGDPAPRYLGRYDHAHPNSYSNGDWWLVYYTDDTNPQRGVWYSNSGTPARITTSSTAALQGKLVAALVDIAWAEANSKGTAADYGGFNTFFTAFGAVTAFIATLFTGSVNISVTAGTNVVKSYHLEGYPQKHVNTTYKIAEMFINSDGGTILHTQQMQIGASGTVRVSMTLKSQSASGTVTGYVYSRSITATSWTNPSGASEHSTTSTSGATFTDDITVVAGDTIAIFIKVSNASYYGTVSGFTIGIAETPGILSLLGTLN